MWATAARMRPTGYLINIGRGAIDVLDDLVAAADSALYAAKNRGKNCVVVSAESSVAGFD